MVFTLQMLEEFLREEGFTIQAIDDFDSDPTDPPHKRHTPWQAVGVERPDGTGAAVEIAKSTASLHIWTIDNYDAPADCVAKIPLADPQCFEKVVAVLRGQK